MKLLLINPPDNNVIDGEMDAPYNLLMLASVIEKCGGAEVEIAEWSKAMPTDIPFADVYGLSITTPTYNSAKLIASKIRQSYPTSKIIAGGAHAQFMPIEFADTTFRGNCLDNLLPLLFEHGYHYCSGNISNTFPLPYDKITVEKYIGKRYIPGCSRTMSVISSIGCNAKCAFCYNTYFGNKLQSYSVDELGQIIKYLVNTYHTDGINFLDDNFLLFQKLWQNMEVPWRASGSIAVLKTINPIELVKAGCKMIYIGIESGADILLQAMNKKQTSADILFVLDKLQTAGIQCRGSFIVGFPGETWSTINATAQIIERFDNVTIHLFVLYPGSDVFFNPAKYGIIWASSNYDDYRSHPDKFGKFVPTFETESLNSETLLAMHSYLESIKPGGSL